MMKRKMMKAVVAIGAVIVMNLAPGAVFGQSGDVPQLEKLCIDRCGDGTCQEIVCLGEGCPCAETSTSCAKDCAPQE